MGRARSLSKGNALKCHKLRSGFCRHRSHFSNSGTPRFPMPLILPPCLWSLHAYISLGPPSRNVIRPHPLQTLRGPLESFHVSDSSLSKETLHFTITVKGTGFRAGLSEFKSQFCNVRAEIWVGYAASLTISSQIFKIGTLTVITSRECLRMK